MSRVTFSLSNDECIDFEADDVAMLDVRKTENNETETVITFYYTDKTVELTHPSDDYKTIFKKTKRIIDRHRTPKSEKSL